jgi:hypothetical protein
MLNLRDEGRSAYSRDLFIGINVMTIAVPIWHSNCFTMTANGNEKRNDTDKPKKNYARIYSGMRGPLRMLELLMKHLKRKLPLR